MHIMKFTEDSKSLFLLKIESKNVYQKEWQGRIGSELSHEDLGVEPLMSFEDVAFLSTGVGLTKHLVKSVS